MQRRTRERAQGEPVRKATVLALVIAGVLAVAYGAWYRPALAPVNPADSRPQLVHVQRGMSARGVVNLLRRTGLVRSRMATLLYAAATRQATKLRPGYYDLAPSMSTPEIVETIASGRIAQRKVVVVPGLTLRQIADRVDRSGLASRRDFLAVAAVARNFSGEVSFPLPEGKSVEGYLFPATYQFPVGTTPAQIISRMLQAFEVNFYRPNCHEIERSPLGLHGLVTLASMVEREAAVDEERPVIAGVLVNRLRMGWKLQCDATVQYALGRHKPRLL
ncbi:MAG: endolytic transglycosylase MltG, partial [Armatimonadetes bacterium]|nr:endolytic transglycosylase MltG [Armatimonadota bacterium]